MPRETDLFRPSRIRVIRTNWQINLFERATSTRSKSTTYYIKECATPIGRSHAVIRNMSTILTFGRHENFASDTMRVQAQFRATVAKKHLGQDFNGDDPSTQRPVAVCRTFPRVARVICILVSEAAMWAASLHTVSHPAAYPSWGLTPNVEMKRQGQVLPNSCVGFRSVLNHRCATSAFWHSARASDHRRISARQIAVRAARAQASRPGSDRMVS